MKHRMKLGLHTCFCADACRLPMLEGGERSSKRDGIIMRPVGQIPVVATRVRQSGGLGRKKGSKKKLRLSWSWDPLIRNTTLQGATGNAINTNKGLSSGAGAN